MILFLLALLLSILPADAASIRRVVLQGSVDPGSAAHLVGAIEDARANGDEAVLVVLDTPGGLLQSARQMVQAELTSEVPIIVWVAPAGARAGSAGVFLTLAAHVAAMAPGTTIGAAHPVDLLGQGLRRQQAPGEQADPTDGSAGAPEAGDPSAVMEAKILEDAAGWARSIADHQGRNAVWAEQAVRESVVATDREALEAGIVDLVASDLPELLAALDGRTVETSTGPRTLSTADAFLVDASWTVRDRVVHFLGDPNVVFLLLALGLLGLWVEYHHPGFIWPGVLGGVSLVAAAAALSILPFNLAGLLLVLAGFGLFAAEIWVPSYGALTVGGVAALVTGAILLFDVEGFDLRISLATIATVAGLAAGIVLLVAFLVLKAHRRRPRTGAEGLAGARAVVTQGGTRGGWVRAEGEIWQATWSGTLEPGTLVRVVSVDHLTLFVEPAGPPPAPGGPS
ncbi:MAG: nodulation protein NfeD [Deltaproteobacteria bacterium]|nr:nodulation protein NfeD [Deltaproteobacteria bacterium]